MREIKFRVWDNQNACWAKEQDVIESMGLEFGINDYWLEENGADKCIRWSFMQFTGLKDKNGKEIYEGDVLNVKCKDGGIVEWPNHLVQWEHIQGYIGFWIPEQTRDRPGKHEYSIEIMGNIHQDPDWITKFAK